MNEISAAFLSICIITYFMKITKPSSNIKLPNFSEHINANMIRNIVVFGGGIFLFIAGVIVYGIILHVREEPLKKAMREKGFTKLNNVVLIVERKNYSINLYEDTVLIKTYRANFGKNVNVPKTRRGDFATPVGNYIICSIDTNSVYHKFLRLNYPNLNDATEALRKGIISQEIFDKLKYEYYNGDCTSADTRLGGNIGLQGIGRLNYIFKYLPFVFNWTNGSIAVSNENIDEIYSVVKKGTKVVIK